MKKLALLFLLMGFVFCTHAHDTSGEGRISRQEAIEIARKQVSFEPQSVEAVQSTIDSVPVWEVVLRNTPEPDPLGNFMSVTINAQTGAIISLARN